MFLCFVFAIKTRFFCFFSKLKEITLWRKADKSRKTQSQIANNPHVPTHLVGGPESKDNTVGIGGGGGLGVGGKNSYENNSITSTTSSGDNDEQHQSTDPKMRLFTRESPDQGMKYYKI